MPSLVFHPVLMELERFGLLVRGILYSLVGVVAVAYMIGASESVDLTGSLTLVEANQLKIPIGIITGLGLIGYSLWGFVRALADPLERGGNWHGIISRLGFLWSATVYGGLSLLAIQLAFGGSRSEAALPFGIEHLLGPQLTRFVLPVFGVVALVTGIGQFMDAWFAPFRSDFLPQTKNPRLWSLWVWAGRVGLFGRGVAFTVLGIVMVHGGFIVENEKHVNYGLTRAFGELLHLPAGAAALVIVALAFVALGLQSAASPPVLRMKPGLDPPVRRRPSKEA